MRKEYLVLLAAGCVAANATNANYDLLGRKGSKMESPMVYKNVDYSKMQKKEQKKLAPSLENHTLAKQASGIKGGAAAIIGKLGPEGYDFKACPNTSTGCVKNDFLSYGTHDLSWYLDKVNSNFINIKSDKNSVSSSGYNYVTAGLTRSGASGFRVTETPYSYTNPIQPSPHQNNKYITYVPISTVNALVGRSYMSSSNVGVYLAENAVPTRLNPNTDGNAPFILADNASLGDFNTLSGYEMRASRMYKALRRFSERSVVYAANGRPSNPAAANPQIYMGLHAYGGTPVNRYMGAAKALDNYIYNNRTIEIVGAGNSAGNLSVEAYAVNAITVGALDPLTGKPTSYTAKNKPKFGNGETYDKPEISAYSNYYIDDYQRTYTSSKQTYTFAPFYDGTEASAALTAGMISNMLSYSEFYKWHPEVVKAVVMNGATFGPALYDEFVFEHSQARYMHQSSYFIGDVNTLMKPNKGECPLWSEYCGDNIKVIRFEFYKDAVFFGADPDIDGFCASIAWLSSGNDVANLGKLPQRFELEGIQVVHTGTNGTNAYIVKDNSYGRANKTVCVADVPYNHSFMIRIILADEDTRSENYGQMVLGLDIVPHYSR